MDGYERGNQSELWTAQRISSLADTLSFPLPRKKDTLRRLGELASPAFRWQIPLNFGWRAACLTSSAERHVRQTVPAAT